MTGAVTARDLATAGVSRGCFIKRKLAGGILEDGFVARARQDNEAVCPRHESPVADQEKYKKMLTGTDVFLIYGRMFTHATKNPG